MSIEMAEILAILIIQFQNKSKKEQNKLINQFAKNNKIVINRRIRLSGLITSIRYSFRNKKR